MKFLGYTINRNKPEKREVNIYNPNLSDSLQYGLNSSKYTALSLSTVYSAVNLISDAIACLPITIKAHNKEGVLELDQHPLKDIFTSNLTTKYTLFKTILQSVLLKGNAYCYIERKAGKVTGLRYLQPEDVQVYYRKETKELYYTCAYLPTKRIMPADMLHFLKYTVDGVQGISVLSHARRSLNIANQTENTAATFFSSGCNLNGVIKVHSNLSNEQKQDIATSWRTIFGSGNTSGGVVVVPSNMDYQAVSVSGEDAQMLQSRQYNVADIARFFNISPVLLGDLSNAGYSTIEATNLQFLSYTLNPYIVMIEEELNRKLVSGGENLEINLDETAILRTDKAQQASYYSTLLSMGVLSINEVRKELGLNEVEGGDNHNLAYNDVSKSNIAGTEEES